MKTGISLTMASLIAILLSGCARPDHVTTIKSPITGVYYTVETFVGHGAAASDFTRVYAHLERNGKSKRVLALSGENITLSKIVWTGPHDDTFCLDGGITDTFRNEVTLIVGDGPDDSETIYNHLEEHCSMSPAASPNGG